MARNVRHRTVSSAASDIKFWLASSILFETRPYEERASSAKHRTMLATRGRIIWLMVRACLKGSSEAIIVVDEMVVVTEPSIVLYMALIVVPIVIESPAGTELLRTVAKTRQTSKATA